MDVMVTIWYSQQQLLVFHNNRNVTFIVHVRDFQMLYVVSFVTLG